MRIRVRSRRPEVLVAQIWAQLVLHRSGWSATQLDTTFFAGSSAFHRYVAGQSAPAARVGQPLATNPFLQIDSLWPGSFRYLVHPCARLLSHCTDLLEVQRAMFLLYPRFRDVLFAGSVGWRRRYDDVQQELRSLQRLWTQARKVPGHRVFHFLDALGAYLALVREAALLGDLQRCRAVQQRRYRQLVSFRQLPFLDPALATYLDNWLDICVLESINMDAHRWAVDDEYMSCVHDEPLGGMPASVFEAVALRTSMFEGRLFTHGELEEAHSIKGFARAIPSPKVQLSWDRSDLAVSERDPRRRSRDRP